MCVCVCSHCEIGVQKPSLAPDKSSPRLTRCVVPMLFLPKRAWMQHWSWMRANWLAHMAGHEWAQLQHVSWNRACAWVIHASLTSDVTQKFWLGKNVPCFQRCGVGGNKSYFKASQLGLSKNGPWTCLLDLQYFSPTHIQFLICNRSLCPLLLTTKKKVIKSFKPLQCWLFKKLKISQWLICQFAYFVLLFHSTIRYWLH